MNEITRRARSLRVAASALEVVAVVSSIGGVLAGVTITAQVGVSATTHAKTHPHVAAGYAVILAAIVVGTLSWCVARAIGAFAIDLAARQGVDITERAPNKLPDFLQRQPR